MVTLALIGGGVGPSMTGIPAVARLARPEHAREQVHNGAQAQKESVS